MTTTTPSPPSEKKLQVNITYNGVTFSFDYKPRQESEALYKHAFARFQVPEPQRAALALYLPDNTTEVDPKVSVEGAKIQPDTTLILRPRGAGGGG